MYKNFKLTEEERKEILESHMSQGYRQPLNELGEKDIDLIKGKTNIRLKGRPSGDGLAAKDFERDFEKEYMDLDKEYIPYWEKDRPNSSGDNIDDLTRPFNFGKPDPSVKPNPVYDDQKIVDNTREHYSKKQELENLEKKITALRLFKDQFGLDEHMTGLYKNLLIKFREDYRDLYGGDVK